jgi:hypothetical protein
VDLIQWIQIEEGKMMEMLTQEQTLKILKVGPITLGRWEKSGQVPMTMVDGKKMYPADAVGYASLLLEVRRPGQHTQTRVVNNRKWNKRKRIKKRQERIQNSIKKYVYGQEVDSTNIHTKGEYEDLIRIKMLRKVTNNGSSAASDTTTKSV